MKTKLWRSQIKAFLEMTYILPRYFFAKDVAYFYFCNALTFFIDKVRFKLSVEVPVFLICLFEQFLQSRSTLNGSHLFLKYLVFIQLFWFLFLVFCFLLLSNIWTESATSKKWNWKKKGGFVPKTYKRSKKAFSNRKENWSEELQRVFSFFSVVRWSFPLEAGCIY